MLESLSQDLRVGFRMLRKQIGFASVAVLSLAIGIGANTAVFSIINSIFLNPLPVKDISMLVRVFTVDSRTMTTLSNVAMTPTSLPNYQDYRDQATAFTGLAASMIPIPVTWGGQAKPEQISVSMVTSNYFDVLGVTAEWGRTFLPEEDQKLGGNPVVVLSHGLWVNRFGADPSITGRTITLNRQQYTIIGVAQPNFKGIASLAGPDLLWMPISMRSSILNGVVKNLAENRRFRWLDLVGRLKPNVTESQAEAELKTIALSLERQYPKENQGRTVQLFSLSESALGMDPSGINRRHQFMAAGGVLTIVVGIVLLIACANIANLLLARAVGREKEVSVRCALGASRWRLARQLLTENVLLSSLGGACGLVLAYWGQSLLWSFRPPFLPANAINLSMDSRVLGFTVLISVLTGLLFGIPPALKAARPDLAEVLRVGGRGGTLARTSSWFRSLLVVSEVALAFIALMGAGLFLRSMQNAQGIDLGIESKNLFMFGFDLSAQRYDLQHGQQFFRDAVDRAQTVPGVEAAAVATNLPLGGLLLTPTVFKEGEEQRADRRGTLVTFNVVTPEFFKTMGIPLVRGRLVNDLDRDNTTPVAVINEATARALWPGEEALGRRFSYLGNPTKVEVVGVVKNCVVNTLGEPPVAVAYFPMQQMYNGSVFLLVRTSGNPEKIMGTVRDHIQKLDSQLALTNLQTIGQLMSSALWAPRMGAALLGLFGVLALCLASIGVYGVMAYSVAQRTGEIGIRIALGATPLRVIRLVFAQGMRLAVMGAALGVFVTVVFSRAASALLYGISPRDPLTLILVTLLLALLACCACAIPAWRATHIDPLEAMRYE